MRNLFIFLLSLLPYLDLSAQTDSYSYVHERVMTNDEGTAWLDHYVYDNGLGLPYQKVDVGITPKHKDLAILQEYDEYLRPLHTWLPGIGEHGDFLMADLLKTSSVILSGDNSPFTTTEYEPSPLNRITKIWQPGSEWRQHGKSRTYSVNVEDRNGIYKIMWLYLFPNSLTFLEYSSLRCLVTETRDEDGTLHLDFKDKDNRTIAKRTISSNLQQTTYYVYDGCNRLRFVLPPAAAAYYESHLTHTYGIRANEEAMLQYAYEYRYDGRGNCIYKRLPGCEPVYFIYDKADRCILSQDGAQRARQADEWKFTIPDIFGRTVLTGVCTANLNYTAEPLSGEVITARWTDTINGVFGYEVAGNVLDDNYTIYSVNYYDNYAFLGQNGVPAADLSYEQTEYGVLYDNAKLLVTGTVTAVLDGETIPTYLYTAMYYDDRSRIIQQKSTNILGGTESTCTKYDFTGHPLKKRHVHTAQGKDTQTELYTYTYDHAGRLLTMSYRLNDNTEVTLASNTYDELGRLKSTIRHGSSTLKTDYDYNVRSWTTKVESPLFKEQLYYNTSHHGSTPQWGGMVSAMDWQTDNVARGYRFLYDGFSRLTQADYMDGGSTNAKYDTRYTYDLMGNMLTLERNGKQDGGSYGPIDDVTFTYNGNQLVKADDAADDPTYAGVYNFRDGSSEEQEYEYDANGNMTKDLNKRISSITYNLLNLPQRIYFETKTIENIVYSADGRKLRATYTFPPMRYMPPKPPRIKVVKTDYCDNVIYQDGKLSQILVDGGYITFSGTTPVYHYYLKDHLGNNRVVAKQDGTVEQVNHYYPFGGLMAESTGGDIQRYKYNGKELDRMFGLDWYDYGARHYDGARAQFTTFDPLAEKDYGTSPYAYCGNDPTNVIDPDGRSGWKVLLKGAYKVGKTAAKNGISSLTKSATYAEAFNDVVDNGKTVFDSNASTWDKAAAGASLLSEIVSPVSIKDAEYVGKAAKGLAKNFSKIGSTGKVGEDALKKLGGVSQHHFETSKGKRIVDQYADDVAHESKVGYQSLTKGIKAQIQKDAELIKNENVKGATWHFFESPVTGKGGPSKPLMDELKKNDIKVEIHK
ncbi:MAG: RHS repeat-associated core domain-containing protein [Prevotella sp.]|nr:RHS repeat-associated core domain-containing protein [Prevotella sp.]